VLECWPELKERINLLNILNFKVRTKTKQKKVREQPQQKLKSDNNVTFFFLTVMHNYVRQYFEDNNRLRLKMKLSHITQVKLKVWPYH